MRVIQLIDSLEVGGAEHMAVNIANALSEKIEKSYLCASRKEGLLKKFLDKKVNYLFLNRKSTLDLKALFKLRKFITKEKIDVIHAHSSSFFIAVLLKFLHPSIKIIWHDHFGNSEYLDKRAVGILKYTSVFFKAIIVVNTKLKSWADQHLYCKNISYIANFVTAAEKPDLLPALKGEQGKRIVCVANLRPQKGHNLLITAFAKIKEVNTGWTLHLIGKGFHDAYEDAVRKQVKDLGLSAHIFFYGAINSVNEILLQCDIGVLSSYSEGLPLALLEYGQCELPIVVTDVGECMAVVQNRKNGVVVEAGNPEALKKGINHLINNPSLRKDMAKNFKRHIENNYSKKKFIEKLMNVYAAS